MSTVSIPFIDLTDANPLMMTEEQSDQILDRVFKDNGHSRSEIPETYRGSRLTEWVWLLYTLNSLDIDPDHYEMPINKGIDLSWASKGVQTFITAIA